VLLAGQPHQIQRWLEPMRQGTAVAGFALTEPDVGSTRRRSSCGLAVRCGWTLHGHKKWITNAPDADFYVTFARTTRDARSRGVTAFLVPADRPGLSGVPIEFIADHPIGALTFDGVPVDRSDVIGEVDRGFVAAMTTFDLFRPSLGAAAVGMARRARRRRRADGNPDGLRASIGSNQAVAHALADVATRLEASRISSTPGLGPRGSGLTGDGQSRHGQGIRHGGGPGGDRHGDPVPRRVRLEAGHLLERLYARCGRPGSSRVRPRSNVT